MKDIYFPPDSWIMLETLVPTILKNRNGCIIEIGLGRSTIILNKISAKMNVRFYTCDIHPWKIQRVMSELIDPKPILFGGSSFEFISQFDNLVKEPLAVVLIDGFHEYKSVITEANFFLERMIEGGVLFMHDTLPPSEEYTEIPPGIGLGNVYKVRQEFEKKTEDYDCFTWPYTAGECGLTMILKKEKNRPYYRL